MNDKGTQELLIKVKKELLPCLRSFTRYVSTFKLRITKDVDCLRADLEASPNGLVVGN